MIKESHLKVIFHAHDGLQAGGVVDGPSGAAELVGQHVAFEAGALFEEGVLALVNDHVTARLLVEERLRERVEEVEEPRRV